MCTGLWVFKCRKYTVCFRSSYSMASERNENLGSPPNLLVLITPSGWSWALCVILLEASALCLLMAMAGVSLSQASWPSFAPVSRSPCVTQDEGSSLGHRTFFPARASSSRSLTNVHRLVGSLLKCWPLLEALWGLFKLKLHTLVADKDLHYVCWLKLYWTYKAGLSNLTQFLIGDKICFL